MLLEGGDLAGQWGAGVETQMSDGRESRVLDFRPEIELAGDSAFIAHVGEPCDGGVGRDRRTGVLSSKRVLEFWCQACRGRQRLIELGDLCRRLESSMP